MRRMLNQSEVFTKPAIFFDVRGKEDLGRQKSD